MSGKWLLWASLALVACTAVETKDGYRELTQKGGPTLTYVDVPLLRECGKSFKDHNRNGEVDPYEDWRLTPGERAADLASKLPPEYLSGLMTIGHTVNVPGISSMSVSGITYNGKPYQESGAEPSDICDRLRSAIENFDTRQILMAHSDGPETIARWNNKVQALCESLPWGIPALNCTDPRNEIKATDEFNAGSGGICSQWPTPLGLAATFDTTVVVGFARTVQREYRALGFGTALSPQADLATDPRWRRVPGTFGENPELVRQLSSAYIHAMQPQVNCIVKHWPGGGAGEGGRDAHLSIGKYAVFPGGRLKTAMDAFCLDSGGVMPYYTVSYGQDPSGENVGNSYSSYIIDTLLRKQYGYEGIVCTDWGIVPDYNGNPLTTGGKCYGVEALTRGERILKALEAGVDEFGGEVFASWLMESYQLWCGKYGADSARARWETSACKILVPFFRSGAFENPYRDPSEAVKVLSDPEAQALGEEAQRRSVVMLKNKGNVIPVISGDKPKVYVPLRKIPGVYSMTGRLKKAPCVGYSVDTAEVAKHYTIAQSPSVADFAIVAITEPEGGIGYKDGRYMPISLQYSPYTAAKARAVSIAGGDPAEKSANRSYKGRRLEVENASDLDLVRDTKARMGDKPVVVLLQTTRPIVMEFEPWADAILVAFGVRSKAFLDIVSGAFNPMGRLPMQFPSDMETVERQLEDVPQDMTPWRDTEGNLYDFGFGL
ncbi:MAG: glycoside hydrolase family 3 C-terminal domain-containing protein [Bacteroidales bacterium]|nr:glycoside hydrolase family 3 C-terminal domain-containing protein [Bacteroidales bacterium]